MIRAAIYVRISDDRAGDAAGVNRQEQDCRARCDTLGWTVADVYRDNDISAYGSKPRPEYRRMLDDIKANLVDAVIVWHLDRLTRRPADLETFFETCDAAGIKHLASCTGDVDLSTHDGRFLARILGAVARKESDDKSRRTSRKHLELADGPIDVGSSGERRHRVARWRRGRWIVETLRTVGLDPITGEALPEGVRRPAERDGDGRQFLGLVRLHLAAQQLVDRLRRDAGPLGEVTEIEAQFVHSALDRLTGVLSGAFGIHRHSLDSPGREILRTLANFRRLCCEPWL